MPTIGLDQSRLARSKAAFCTRRVNKSMMKCLISGDIQPRPGDLTLARVDELGKQTRIELTDGRRAFLFPGDEIVVSFGNRYAPDQFEALIGFDLSPCDLVAAGGVAALELARHVKIAPPTQITPLGLIGDAEGNRINLLDHRVEASDRFPRIPAVLSLGTSMNAGKSLTAASMVRGFKRLGMKVAALKITGTGSGGDMWIAIDAGADVVVDFTDAGYASTYLTPISELESAAYRLLNHAADAGCDIAVVEIADGLQQPETAELIRSPAIQRATLATVFASFDSMGAQSGVSQLREAGHDLIGLSGKVGMSPLGVREAEAITGLRYFGPIEIQDGVLVPIIRQRAAEKLAASPDGMEAALTRIAGTLVSGSLDHQKENVDAEGADVQRAAGHVLQLVANAIVNEDTKQVYSSGQVQGIAGLAGTPLKYETVVWSSPMGMLSIRVPYIGRRKYTPGFLNCNLPVEAVTAVVETVGTPRCQGALRRLVAFLGGQRHETIDLRPILSAIENVCDEMDIAPFVVQDVQSLTIDDMEAETIEEAQEPWRERFGSVAADVPAPANVSTTNTLTRGA